MKMFPYKWGDLCWRVKLCSILISQCIWNLVWQGGSLWMVVALKRAVWLTAKGAKNDWFSVVVWSCHQAAALYWLQSILYSMITCEKKEKWLHKTTDFLFKIRGSEFSVLFLRDSCIIVTGRHLMGKHGSHFVMLRCFCIDLKLIIQYFNSLIGTIMYREHR
jgi:hypothetical protein